MKDIGHFAMSVIKSALRVVACVDLAINRNVATFAILFGLAELFGVFEEIIDKR